MGRSGKVRQEQRREEKFARLNAAATHKFDMFKQLNSKIDAKTSSGMTQAEKLQLENERAVARTAKAKIVARQTYATIDEIGAGNSKGMYFEKGERTNQVRGKVKEKKKGSAPAYNPKSGKIVSKRG